MADERTLNQREVDAFIAALDKDRDGNVSYSELEQRLDAVYEELQPEARHYNLHHDSRQQERHEFLRGLLSTEKDFIPVEDFKKKIVSWSIPSLEKDREKTPDLDGYMKQISWPRRLRAVWEVDGPEYLFLSVVVSLQIGIGAWQCVKYSTGAEYQAALGWGVGMAKAAAGALYPTLFFMLLSMSRWFSTWMRKSYYISRVINWDLGQSFHIIISCVALTLASVHAIGHLSGSFVYGSRPNRQNAVADLLGPDAIPRPYVAYIRSTPGWTGLTALGLFYTIASLSIPYIRKKSYEIFQVGHLLMFPMLGLLMAHGTAAYLQFPVLGLVLAVPTLLVLAERLTRILSGFQKIPASLAILDEDTVRIACTIPGRRIWKYKAGQYVFLQVPQISRFQWHPFTISTCIDRQMQLHIKTDGDWTSQLRGLKDLSFVGIDGPYGAPAQRFYDFDQTVIVGAGIGVTPFSGILNDLQERENHHWNRRRDSTSSNESNELTRPPVDRTATMLTTINGKPVDLERYRRVDFHWIVRDKNHLLWFSDLLNKISSEGPQTNPHLDIRIHNHLTKKRTDISQHIFRWLLEKHRTESQTVSPLTGLIAPTHFGRPDFPKIMNQHYEDMLQLVVRDRGRKRKVGVFFCGAPVIGHALADVCHQMTLRGREDGSEIEYHFMMEVFG
jgi:dual oxidase